MTAAIDFYFDFSSPYGYLAALEIDARAARHGRAVDWRPFLLGVAFGTTGSEPLLQIPLKGDYARHDLLRTARRLNVPFTLPAVFPFMSQAACRAYYVIADADPPAAKALAKRLYTAAFGEGRDIAPVATVVTEAAALGHDPDALAASLRDPDVKERLRAEVDAAIAKGVFGSPTFVVDGEVFWGHDRLDDLERWLDSGGW